MLVNFVEISSIDLGDEQHYWGLIDGGQLVFLNKGKDLSPLIKKEPTQCQEFTIMDETVKISKWMLKKVKNMAIPQDKLLETARLLICDRKGLYTLFHLIYAKLDMPLNKEELFKHNKDDWYKFLFHELYEEWKAYDEEKEPDEKLRILELDEYWQRTTKPALFQKWMKTNPAFVLRCVGDKYHLEKDQIKLLTPGQAINLLLESHNDMDNRAISIYLPDGKQLGYLRKPVARKLYDRLNYEKWTASISWVDAEQYANYRIIVALDFCVE